MTIEKSNPAANEASVQLAASEKGPPTKLSGFASKETIPNAWRIVLVPPTEVESVALIEECSARRVEMLRRLGRVTTMHRAKKLIRAYFRSESARIATLALVAARKGEAKGPQPKWTARRIVEQGKKLLLEKVGNHPIWVQPMTMGEPESRAVFDFGVWDTARATLAHDAIKATFRLPEWMFQYNGGEAAARKWVRQRLPNAKLVLTSDFPKNFLLLPWQLVMDGLPLSERATEALLFEPWKRAKARGFGLTTAKPQWGCLFVGNIHMGDHGDVGHADLSHCACEIGAGRALPPGSVLAPLAAQIVLMCILQNVPELHADGVEIGLISDNLIILLNDEALEGPVRHGLEKMALKNFDAATARQFCKRTTPHNPKRFFRYIGRWLRAKKGETQLLALPEHCDRIIDRILADLSEAKTVEDLRRPVRRARGFLIHHGAAPNAADAIIHAILYTGAHGDQLAAKLKKVGFDLGDLLEAGDSCA